MQEENFKHTHYQGLDSSCIIFWMTNAYLPEEHLGDDLWQPVCRTYGAVGGGGRGGGGGSLKTMD